MIPTVGVDVLVRLADKLTAPLREAEGVVAKASERMKKQLNLSMKLAGAGAAASGVAFGAQKLVTGFTDSIRDVERAKGELATLGVQDLDAVVRRGMEMQGKLAGVTADAFVRASYDIKSGISSLTDQGVADMTASAMLVAKATKGQAEQMTSLFATSYGIFKKHMGDLTDAEFGEQFGAALSASVQQFKTDGAKMQQAIESAGAGAANLGMAMNEQLTLLGMMQQQMQAGEAGTALASFSANAAAAHENFQKMKVTASKPVRVRILDAEGGLRAMPDILADLRARYGETLDAFESAEIKKAFGSDEAMKLINALYGQEEAVRANGVALGKAADQGQAYTEQMAQAADANWDSVMTILSQKLNLISMAIGQRLLPVVQALAPKFDAIIDKTLAWIDANPKLITAIGVAVAGLGALTAVAAPILIALGTLTATWATTSIVATRMAVSVSQIPMRLLSLLNPLKIVRGAFVALRMAMISTGIGAILVGLAVAGAWIYRNWQGLANFFKGFGRAFSIALKPAAPLIDKVSKAFSLLMGWVKKLTGPLDASAEQWQSWGEATGRIVGQAVQTIINVFKAIPGFFRDLWSRLTFAARSAWDRLSNLFNEFSPANMIYRMWDSVTEWFGTLWDRLRTRLSEGWEAIKAMFLAYHPLGMVYAHWDSITDWFGTLWDRLRTRLSEGWEAIKAMFLTYHPLGMVYAHWDEIADWFGGLWDRVRTAFSDGWTRIKTDLAGWPSQMKETGQTLIQQFIDGIKAKMDALRQTVSNAVAAINPFKSALDLESEAKQSASAGPPSGLSADRQQSVLDMQAARLSAMGVPGYAGGGDYDAGPIVVGENGPELRYESRGGYIAHNGALRNMLSMASRAHAMAGRIGQTAATAAAPTMASVAAAAAPMVQPAPVQMSSAPTYNISIQIDGPVDMEEVRATVRQELDAAHARAQYDMRRALHDGYDG